MTFLLRVAVVGCNSPSLGHQSQALRPKLRQEAAGWFAASATDTTECLVKFEEFPCATISAGGCSAADKRSQDRYRSTPALRQHRWPVKALDAHLYF
jgi:hypothetical protein